LAVLVIGFLLLLIIIVYGITGSGQLKKRARCKNKKEQRGPVGLVAEV
jgi:hypothetical protein